MEDDLVVKSSRDRKFQHLRSILGNYTTVAVAFSGGVDSTVLLDNCCKIFKAKNVYALHARSCLQAATVIQGIELVIEKHFVEKCRYHVIQCDPLAWDDFIDNSARRCYFCKKRSYALLLEKARQEGCEVLLDGTNADDLHEHRPGLQAAREHGVLSPFLEAAISKHDIREYAKAEKLINHDLPSNSCLATRIPQGEQISFERLTVIENAEKYLLSLGLAGVRVRPESNKRVFIELLEKDLLHLADSEIRKSIISYCQVNELGIPFVNLKGR